MADLPSRTTLAEALVAAAAAHRDYERTALRGGDPMWSGFHAAFVLGRLGDFAPAGRLAALLEEVENGNDWADAAAAYVLMKLRS